MKKSVAFLLLACMVISALSCTNKKGNTVGDYVLIYSVGGIAGGSHGPFYLISYGRLQADTTTLYLQTYSISVNQLKFDYQLPAAKYNQVNKLLTSIPAEMMTNNGKDFGNNPGNDLYSMVVKASINGQSYSWGFESDKTGCGTEINQYASMLSQL